MGRVSELCGLGVEWEEEERIQKGRGIENMAWGCIIRSRRITGRVDKEKEL